MPDANLRYTFLLGCLILGPIIIIVSLTNKWLWFPLPDLGRQDDIHMLLDNEIMPGHLQIDPVTGEISAEDSMFILTFNIPEINLDRFDGELVWNGDTLEMYEFWDHARRGDEPTWIFTIHDSCLVYSDGQLNSYTPENAGSILDPVAYTVEIDELSVSYYHPTTASITTVYMDEHPSTLMRRHNGAIRWLIVGVIMSIIGAFYFYGPRRGWLKWRQGLTLPDDIALFES